MTLTGSILDSILDMDAPRLLLIGGACVAGMILLVSVWFFARVIWQPRQRSRHKLTWRQSLDLPLLRKELKELAARRRTYIVRVLYGCLLLTVSWASMAGIAARASGQGVLGYLGTGKSMYDGLLWFQACGVLLMTPALACGAITSEKERNTLGLLFLTRLGPWGILLEKLFSRLIPIMTFLLLSMPLFAIAYSFGGVQMGYMFSTIGALFAVAVQMATLSLLCSTIFRTTAAAFIWSYMLQLCVFGVWFFVAMLYFTMWMGPPSVSHVLWIGTCSAAVVAALNMCLARFFLVRRAFVQPKQVLLKFFKKLDRSFHTLNDRYTRGIVLVKEDVGLPDDQPIAWRETKKRSLGTVRYLFRIFVAVELPLVALCLLITTERNTGTGALPFALGLVWVLAILILTVQAAGLIASERTHETLNVLLTTNLSTREIMQQKYAGVKRVMQVLRVPLLTVCVFEFFIFGGWRRGAVSGFNPLCYVTCSLLAIWIYPQFVGWIGVAVSLFVKRQSRAVLTTLSILLAWILAPLFVVSLMDGYLISSWQSSTSTEWTSISRVLRLASPATIIGLNESRVSRWLPSFSEPGFETWIRMVIILLNFTFYGLITLKLRQLCYTYAGVRLGRNEGTRVKKKTTGSGTGGVAKAVLITAESDS